MELLLGALITVLTQIYKTLVKKIGKLTTDLAIYIVVLVLSIVATLWQSGWEIDLNNYTAVLQMFGIAVATYEVVIKWLFVNVIKTRVIKAAKSLKRKR